MIAMKVILSLVAMATLALSAGAALAADAPAAAPAEGAKAPTLKTEVKNLLVWWADQVALTEDQKAQIKTILATVKEDVAKAEGLEAKAKVLRDAAEKIKAVVLTDEQRKKLQELRQSLVGLVHDQLQAMADRFGLAEEQIAAALDILKAAHEEAQQVKELVAKVKIYRDALEAIRTKVLTDEQRQKIEDLRAKFEEIRAKLMERTRRAAPADAPAQE
jgi:hypothetical protein